MLAISVSVKVVKRATVVSISNVLRKDVTMLRDYAEYFVNSPLGNTLLVIHILDVQLIC